MLVYLGMAVAFVGSRLMEFAVDSFAGVRAAFHLEIIVLFGTMMVGDRRAFVPRPAGQHRNDVDDVGHQHHRDGQKQRFV